MDIVLDTNIFRSDIALKSKDVDAVLDYLVKTDSKIIVPRIILDEIKGVYGRMLNERLNDVAKSISKLRQGTFHQNELPDINLNVADETEAYIEEVIRRLRIDENKIIPYKNDYLNEIVRRAIERRKPIGEDGQSFRDALIWLTLLDYAKSCHEKQIVFISANTKDFADNSGLSLHPELEAECETVGIKIKYFRSIKEFIENHSVTIDFITEEWIETELDYDDLRESICDKLNSRSGNSISSKLEELPGMTSTGRFNALRASVYGIGGYFVYEMLNNQLLVNATIYAEVEIEYDYWAYDPILDRNDPFYFERHIFTGTTWLPCEAYVEIIVENSEVVDVTVSDVYY